MTHCPTPYRTITAHVHAQAHAAEYGGSYTPVRVEGVRTACEGSGVQRLEFRVSGLGFRV
eukprot:3398916-Rhodomonas_salina.1